MHKRFLLSFALAVMGAGLLVAASFAGSTSRRHRSPARAEAKRGGTLRINLSETDFEFLDPSLSYDAPGWQVLYSTNVTLLNYPDKPGAAGARLVAEGAAAMPVVSRDGKTYTFRSAAGCASATARP